MSEIKYINSDIENGIKYLVAGISNFIANCAYSPNPEPLNLNISVFCGILRDLGYDISYTNRGIIISYNGVLVELTFDNNKIFRKQLNN